MSLPTVEATNHLPTQAHPRLRLGLDTQRLGNRVRYAHLHHARLVAQDLRIHQVNHILHHPGVRVSRLLAVHGHNLVVGVAEFA